MNKNFNHTGSSQTASHQSDYSYLSYNVNTSCQWLEKYSVSLSFTA